MEGGLLTVRGILLWNARSRRNQGKRAYGDNGRSNDQTNESSFKAWWLKDGLEDYELSNDFEVEQSSDEENTPANDSFSKVDGYHAVPPPIIGNFLTSRVDISFAGLDEYAIRKKIIESKTTNLNTKPSETVDDEDDVSEVQTVSPVKTNETQTVKTRVDKIDQTSQKQSQEPKMKSVVNTGPKVDKPIWDNTKRVNHQKISKYPHLRKTFVPTGVLTRTGQSSDLVAGSLHGSSGKDKGPTQEYILLPLQPHRIRIRVEDVSPGAHEKPSESYPKDNDVQDSEDVADKGGQHQMTEDEQVLHDDLEMMIAQEVVATALDDATRQAFEKEKRNIASQKIAAQTTSITKLSTGRSSVSTATTSYVSAASTSTGANAGESSFVYLEGKIPIDAYTLPNADLPIDPNMPDLEDDSDPFLSDGIFNGAYDDENVGAEADFNNMDDTINVSPIPTL
ncbi:hypothetical protein Tco_0282291 [Tanacetum coccineum]